MAGIHSEARLSAEKAKSDCISLNTLYQKNIVSINDLSLNEIELILNTAAKIKQGHSQSLLQDKMIASCFFEPSTRTRLSFEVAIQRLNGKVVGFSSGENTSLKKGESLEDSIRVIGEYADLLVIRHPLEGAARLAANILNIPVINAGDGANQHPTQTLLDLFTIKESQNKLDGLSIALVGDLKHSRTIHSFLLAAKHFDVRLFLVSPEVLSLPQDMFDELKHSGVRFSFHESIEEVVSKIDILYMTRIQKERMTMQSLLEEQYILRERTLSKAKANLKILHPLPRNNEIETAVDATPHAHYFQQAANGVCVRQAILSLLLNKEIV